MNTFPIDHLRQTAIDRREGASQLRAQITGLLQQITRLNDKAASLEAEAKHCDEAADELSSGRPSACGVTVVNVSGQAGDAAIRETARRGIEAARRQTDS